MILDGGPTWYAVWQTGADPAPVPPSGHRVPVSPCHRAMNTPDDPRTALPPQTPEGLVALLESRRPQLMAYIERRLGAGLRRKIEPPDIYQETAVAALNAWPTLDLGDRDPFGWLCQVAEQ